MNRAMGAPTAFTEITALTANGDTRARWRPGERLDDLLEEAATRYAERIAVEWAGGEMTFAELDRAANRLARYLLAEDYGPGDVLALLFDRSPDSYVALFAVLKINAAYVPLDPVFPADRVCYIVEDARACAVLTTAEHAEIAAAGGVPAICLDTLAEACQACSGAPLDAPAPQGELAYIIYTSGTTGRPKGVLIEHASIVHFVRVAIETYGYRAGDRVYQGLTLAFDFSVEEIIVPLAAGATLVPSQAGVRLVGEDLHDFLLRQRITVICCVPTLLASIDGALPDLRLLIVSGEACPEEIVRRWHSDDRTILNAYGPTETTVTATLAVLKPGAPVTIGQPLPGYWVVVLDPAAPRVLGIGETGEIGIAGIGLSPGYLGRDDLTAKAFVADFVGLPDNPSGRIYRTGDLGRILPGGSLECRGRIDTQVKIRGYRIELSEIESVLMQQPAITQAVVEKYEPTPGTVELAAYYSSSSHVAARDLARGLRDQLPRYMLPAYYEPMAALPMLASDKVDRKSLPAPSGARLCVGGAYVAPEGGTETRLAELVAEVLGVEKVSVTDDFFDDLGANSFLMARVSSRIRSVFGTDRISMRDLYQAPTVRALARQLASVEGEESVARPATPPHVASDFAYWATGAYQIAVMVTALWGGFSVWSASLTWVMSFDGLSRYLGTCAVLLASLLLLTLVPIAAKWLLIGRYRARTFPVWSVDYARFWTVKTLMLVSPLAWVPGTPLYNLYLRALGARVAWSAVVQCRPPGCPDLLGVGENAVIGREVYATCYHAEAGRITCGGVKIGAECLVGDGSVLDIDTRMEDGAELAHASSLHPGQIAAANCSYEGTPAQETARKFRTLENATVSGWRRIAFSLAQVFSWTCLFGALSFLIAAAVVEYALGLSGGAEVGSTVLPPLPVLLLAAAALYFGAVLLGLVILLTVPRLPWAFLRAGRVYPLYGVHFVLFQMIVRTSNSRFFNTLFGDSALVVPYLRALGYRMPDLVQTGSNFGIYQRHDVPFLCEFGSGTMVSDSLIMANAEFSSASFRLGPVRFGKTNFIGNEIVYPTNGRTGDNVLFGTKTLVPVHGPVREDTGLLGSPAFAIPRSVQRDREFDCYDAPELRAERMSLKLLHNLATMGLFLLARYGALALFIALEVACIRVAGLVSPLGQAIAVTASLPVMIAYLIVVERATTGFGPQEPHFCSIYDRYFWSHERFWKMSVTAPLFMLGGTPFKGLVLRALGMRVGRKLFDDGCGIPERTLVTLGDYVTLNTRSTIQAHSLEDGAFKSDRIWIGSGATLGVKAFIHYGTRIGDGTVLASDCFLMKGEDVPAQARWTGNPAAPDHATADHGALGAGGPMAIAI